MLISIGSVIGVAAIVLIRKNIKPKAQIKLKEINKHKPSPKKKEK
ncbi:MAG: hypothetical protein ACFFC1_05055 [Promethearchaeota archaeon]